MQKGEFEEIGHSGGKVTITVIDDPDGRREYQLAWRHCRPNAAGVFAERPATGNCCRILQAWWDRKPG